MRGVYSLVVRVAGGAGFELEQVAQLGEAQVPRDVFFVVDHAANRLANRGTRHTEHGNQKTGELEHETYLRRWQTKVLDEDRIRLGITPTPGCFLLDEKVS